MCVRIWTARKTGSIDRGGPPTTAVKVFALDSLDSVAVSHNNAIAKREILPAVDGRQLVYLSSAEFPPGEVAERHYHADMTEVFIAIAGSGEIQIDESVHALCAGHCAIVAPGEAHEIRNTGDVVLELLYLGYV